MSAVTVEGATGTRVAGAPACAGPAAEAAYSAEPAEPAERS
ncbi:MAG: hypothetical protein QOE01_445, partial [Actinomycetota bacterium]|nr:hypothetical protein [Actinomycetota bacterium]